MDTRDHLKKLVKQTQELTEEYTDEPATKADICQLATALSELATIVQRKLYPDEIPSKPRSRKG